MTTEIQERFTIKGKRKGHPNAEKYPGRPSMEFTNGLRNFLGDLSETERDQFQEGTLVFEEESSAVFYDSIEVGDVVGLGVLQGFDEHKQPAAYKFKITEICEGQDLMKARNVTWEDAKARPEYKGEEVEVAFEDFSVGFGMGFGEILERDGKPFGVSEEIDYNFVVSGSKPTAEEAKAQAAAGKKAKKKATKKKKAAATTKVQITSKKVKTSASK